MVHVGIPSTVVLTFVLLTLAAGCSNKTPDAENGGKSPTSKTSTEKSAAPPKESPDDVKAEPIALADFPMPEGVQVASTFADTGTIMMRGPNKLDEQFKFYETTLGGKGWKKNEQESEIVDGVGFLQLNKGTLSIDITFNPSNDGKKMSIFAQGSGVSVPEDADPSDP